MEGDDGPTCSILQHAVAAFMRFHVVVIVFGHYIPQNHLVTLVAQRLNLLFGEPSVGRSHQPRVDNLRGQFHIVNILFGTYPPAVKVTVGVIAYGMALIEDAFVDFRVVFSVAPEAEECCLGVIFGQIVEYPFGDTGRGAVVESEKQLVLCVINLPLEFREKLSDELWRMVYYANHFILFLQCE